MSESSRPKSIIYKFGYPTILTAVLIYFAQGLRSFASTATTLYLKSKFNLDPAELTLVSTITFIAWYLKPIYGLISDCFPLFGYRRRSYIFLFGLQGIVSYILIYFAESSNTAITCLALGEMSQAVSDVICDGFLVERSKIDPVNGAHDLQIVSWSTSHLASMIGMISGGFAADYFDPTYLVCALAVCPLLVIITSFVIPDTRVEQRLKCLESFKRVWESLKTLWLKLIEKETLQIILFTLCWQSSSIAFGAITVYFLLDVIAVQPSTISLMMFLGYLGSFIGTILSGKGLKLNLINRLVLGRILNNITSLLDIILFTRSYQYLGLSYHPFLFGSSSLGSIIDMYFSQMPMLIIFAHITPPNIEATFFAATCSIFNISLKISEIFASLIMYSTGINDSHSQSIWMLSVISMGIGMLSLIFIYILPESVIIREKVPGDVNEYKDIELPLLK